MIRAIDKNQVYHFLGGLAVILFAVWLLSPFIKIEPSDYAHGKENVFRLIVGLLILLIILGKQAFDIFFPQGIAEHVSIVKTVLLTIYTIFIIGFMIYVVAQAATLYIQVSSQSDSLF
jgi:hypothetical protein